VALPFQLMSTTMDEPLATLDDGDREAALLSVERVARREIHNAATMRGTGWLGVTRGCLRDGQGAIQSWEAALTALGALMGGEAASVRATLEQLFTWQAAEGAWPTRVYRRWRLRDAWGRCLGRGRVDGVLDAAHYDAQAIKSALLWVYVAAEYVAVTGERSVLANWYAPLSRALAWVQRQGVDDLFTGALYYQACKALGEMAVILGDAVAGARHWAEAVMIRERLGDACEAGNSDEACLWAVTTGLASRKTASDLMNRTGGCQALVALAAAVSGDGQRAWAALRETAAEVRAAGTIKLSEAGLFLRALAAIRVLHPHP